MSMDTSTHRDRPMKIERMQLKDDDLPIDV